MIDLRKRIKRTGLIVGILALFCGGTVLALPYGGTGLQAGANRSTIMERSGPVQYYRGYHVTADGCTEPVIRHHGYVVNSRGAMEMNPYCQPAAPAQQGPYCGPAQSQTTQQDGYCGPYQGQHGGYHGGCHR